MPAIALYQPDIPQNVGAVMRISAAFGLPLHIIEPTGFIWDEARIKKVAMDYIQHVQLARHNSWNAFLDQRANGSRLILATTKGSVPHYDIAYRDDDILLFGRESAGVPEEVHNIVDARIHIPMAPQMRSLNLAVSVGIVAAEALRSPS